MNLPEFDQRIFDAREMQRAGRDMLRCGEAMEEQTYAAAGLVAKISGQGYPCWTHPELPGEFFSNPRDVVKALEKLTKKGTP